MSEPGDPLSRLWAQTEAPVRDAVFELAVEEALVRRRLVLDAASWCGVGLLAAVALWVGWPAVTGLTQAFSATFASVMPIVSVAAAMTGLAIWLGRPAAEMDG